MSAHSASNTLVQDLRRMAPVWGLVTGTALVVALSLRYTSVWHLKRSALAEENACVYAEVHYTAARNLLPEILKAAANERANRADFNVSSLASLAGDPLALEARDNLLRAIEICPVHAPSYRLLSLLEWHLGNELDAQIALGDYSRLSGQHDQAVMAYEMAAQIDATAPRLLVGQSLALLAQNRLQEALALVEANEDAMTTTTAGKLAVGRILSAANRNAQAETLLRDGLRENPTDAAAVLEYYWSMRRQEKWREGADFLLSLGRDGKRTVTEAYHLAAAMYRHLGDLPQEQKSLERALELFPNNLDIRWELAICLNKQGKVSAARDQILRTMDYNSAFVLERLKTSPLSGLVTP